MYRLFITTCFLSLYCFSYAQVDRIIIDEDFSDWPTTPLYEDPTGDGNVFGSDLRDFYISHDDQYIFLRLEFGFDLLLQDNNNVKIYLDTDNNPATGIAKSGIGAELEWNLGQRQGTLHLNNTFFIQHHDIGLVTAPTVSGQQFEIAIRRDISTFFNQPFFQGDEVKVVIQDDLTGGDQIPDQNGGILYTFSGSPTTPLPSYSIARQSPDHLRILSQNVLRDELFENFAKPAYTRILQAIQPDIIGFQEIYDHTSSATADLVETILQSSPNQNWYHANANPDIICLSRYPILASHKIPGFQQSQGNGAFLIDTENVFGQPLLYIVAHLPCCNNNTERQDEIDLILAFIRDAKAGLGPIPIAANTPILISGDMNLVGFKSQQTSLITGNIDDEDVYGDDLIPDWDGAPFTDAKPISTNQPMTSTWIKSSSSFYPGRLDYILYTASVMDLQNSYVLNTETLPTDSLTQYNLEASDITIASDHLPMVADFTFSMTTAVNELTEEIPKFRLYQNQPNPFSESSMLTFELPERQSVDLSLYSLDGQLIQTIQQGTFDKGLHTFTIQENDIQPGFYIYILKGKGGQLVRKMIKF